MKLTETSRTVWQLRSVFVPGMKSQMADIIDMRSSRVSLASGWRSVSRKPLSLRLCLKALSKSAGDPYGRSVGNPAAEAPLPQSKVTAQTSSRQSLEAAGAAASCAGAAAGMAKASASVQMRERALRYMGSSG